MKKIIIVLTMLIISIAASGQTTKVSQKDTILVTSTNIKLSKETYEVKDGEFRVSYFALIDGEWYYTTKSSYTKYMTIKRLGGTPNVYFVKPRETKVKTTPKVIVL